MEKQIENLILSKSTGTSSLKEQYEKDISELGETIHNLGLEELTVREREVTLFEESIGKHSVWKLLKMSHFNFDILALSTNFCPIKTELSGNTVWPQALGF